MSRRYASVKAARSLSSAQARTDLPQLLKSARAVKAPARSLASRAIEIGPYNKGGAWLVPELDAQAAIQREAELRERVAELEDQLETVLLAAVVHERLSKESGARLSGVEFIRELGFDGIAEEIVGTNATPA